MVWCMKDGVIWNTSAADVLESEWMWELKKALRCRDIKIVEDEFDESGRAKVKIVYLDAGDWSYRYTAKNDYYCNFIMDSEKKMIAKLNNKNNAQDRKNYWPGSEKRRRVGDASVLVSVPPPTPLRRPRLIFVTQDKDYWPGSENDPEAMERRTHKAENFFGLEVGPSGCGFDYMEIYVPKDSDYHCDIDDRVEIDHRGFPVDKDERYIRYFDPCLPGAKFIRQNMHQMDLKQLYPRLEAVAKKFNWSWP